MASDDVLCQEKDVTLCGKNGFAHNIEAKERELQTYAACR